jgi:hypothetical protein
MATSTAIGYNTGSTISGTQQIGNLAVVTATTVNPSLSPNGVKFWMGPDEDLGYVVAIPVSGGTQSTPIVGVTSFLGFIRSSALTESSFISMVNSTFNQNFVSGNTAKTYLNNNGYWTSFVALTPTPTPTNTITPTITPTGTPPVTPTITPTPTVSPLLLNTYAGASAAYSLRKLRNGYSGSAIRVQRSSDSTEQDIGFVNNVIDTTSLATFVGAGTGTVVVWYDQSGNGFNLIKDSSIAAPEIRIAGTNQSLNGKISIYFNSNKILVGSAAFGTSIFASNGSLIAFGVGNALDSAVRCMLTIGGSPYNSQTIRNGGSVLEAIAYQDNFSTYTDSGSVSIGTNQFIACTERNVSGIEIFTNTQSNGPTTALGSANNGSNSTTPILGYQGSTSYAWYGNIQEIIIFALDPSLNTTYKTNVSNAINSYYTTY